VIDEVFILIISFITYLKMIYLQFQ